MEKFTISMPNKKADPNGIYKDYLLKRLLMSYPELAIAGIDADRDYSSSYRFVGPNDRILFGPCAFSKADVTRCCKDGYLYCPFLRDVENYDIATNFELTMKKLDDYYKERYGYKKLYDFKLPDGTPVKEYQNFIQIGYKLIPKNNIRNTLNSLTDREKIVINTFIITINNMNFNI